MEVLELILILGGIYYLGTKYGDSVGVVLIGLLVIVLLCLFCSGWRSGGKAIGHWIDYWSEGGDKRK